MIKKLFAAIAAFFKKYSDPVRILILVVAAIAGLWLSSGFILSNKKNPPFHEIAWNPKHVIQTLVNNERARIDSLTTINLNNRDLVLDRKLELWNRSDTDATSREKTKKFFESVKTRSGYVADSLEEVKLKALDKIQTWLDTKTDTAIRREIAKDTSLYLHTANFTIDEYAFDSLRPDAQKLTPKFAVTYIHKDLPGRHLTDSITLETKRYPATERFFNKYPGFALWSLLLIIQAVLYCLLIAGFFFHFLSRDANKLYTTHLGHKLVNTLLVLAGMGVFLFAIFGRLLSDDEGQLVSGKVFMDQLHLFFKYVNIPGHIAAAFCLAGMIGCVIFMNVLARKTADGTIAEKDREELRSDIKRRFRVYFVFAAIILSLAVFTSGTFFSSMNGMEFIKQVTKDQGFSPVNSEMVYIYGILYSFFLLLIYLPLRYTLTSIDKSIPPPVPKPVTSPSTSGTSPNPPPPKEEKEPILSKLLSSLSGMKDVLVAVSPFLASLFQELLNAIFS